MLLLQNLLIPIDPFYLTWKAREFGLHTRFIELAGEVNTSMPQYVISKIADGLNSQGKSIKGSKILMLGVAYKKNVDDMRESPSVELIEMLLELGADVDYHDPYVPVLPPMREHQLDMKSMSLNDETINSYACVILATDHDGVDYDHILKNCALFVDSRGVIRKDTENLVRA